MKYKQILQWMFWGFLMINWDFGNNVVKNSQANKFPQVEQSPQLTKNDQQQNVSLNKILKFNPGTKAAGPVPLVKPLIPSNPANPVVKPIISVNPAVRAVIPPLVGAASGAALVAKTLSPSSNEASPPLPNWKKPFRHDTLALNKFLKENKVFKTIHDSNSYNGNNSFDPETIELFVPHYDYVIASQVKITYKQLLEAYKDIETNQSNLDTVSQQSTQIVTSFSRLKPAQQKTIEEQEVQVEKIKNLVVDIKTNITKIKTDGEIQLKLFDLIKENLEKQKKEKEMLLSRLLEDKKKNQENLIKINQVDLLKEKESIGNGSKKKQANKTNANYKETELKKEETELKKEETELKKEETQLKNLQYTDQWIEDQILRAKANITKIEEKLNSYNKEKIGQYFCEYIFKEIQLAKQNSEKKSYEIAITAEKTPDSIFQKMKKGASKSWLSFSSNKEPIDAKFLKINRDGNNQTLIIDWPFFFKDQLTSIDLTYAFPVTLDLAIKEAIEDLTSINKFCSELTTIKQSIDKTPEFQKFCKRYFYDEKDSQF